MTYAVGELIKLWNRAAQTRDDASDIRAVCASRLETSEARLRHCAAEFMQSGDQVVRSKTLLARTRERLSPPRA